MIFICRTYKYNSFIINIMNEQNYGYNFNEIMIYDNTFIKKCKNDLGRDKINNEITFYKYIEYNNIKFNIPKLLEFNDGIIKLEYLYNSKNITKIINKNNYEYYLEKIINDLKILHESKILIQKDELLKDLYIETKYKIINRYNESNWNQLTNILYVNGLRIRNINYYVDKIHQKILLYFDKIKTINYSLIHGDVHLGNILIDNSNNIYYIDPRGYFGNKKLFGLHYYDYAKLMFGLSGYSIFDEMIIDKLNIIDNNINIDFIKEYEYIFISNKFNEIVKLLTLSIWLGNCSNFCNSNKKITSLMISYYYCEKYINT